MSNDQITRWSYSGSPSTSDKDAVRFLIGDTLKNDPQLDDREIEYLLTLDSVLESAISAATTLQARYARDVDSTQAKTGESRSVITDHYAALVKTLIAKRARVAVAAFAGGLSKDQKHATELDSDRVTPAFTKNLHDARVSRVDPLTDTQKDNFG